jgi:hypothetical protein
MSGELSRIWHEIAARPGGPLAMRFYVQPLMATILAFRDGRKDAHQGKPAYGWAVLNDAAHRHELLRSGWRSIGKVFLIAVALDTVYQLIVFHGLRPLQGLIVAAALALVPYLLLRGPFNRIVRLLGWRPTDATRPSRQRQPPPRAA